MSVRWKALLLVGVVFAASLALLHTVAHFVLIQGYRHLETEECREDLQQAHAVIVHDVAQLESAASDWARWDEAYQFVQTPTDQFIHENLRDQSFRNLHLNAIVFVQPSGRVVFAKGFDLAADHAVALPPALLAMLAPGGVLRGQPDKSEGIVGLVRLPQGPMLVAALPILPSDTVGEPRGVLLWGRYFDRSAWSYLTHLARLPVRLTPYDGQLPEPPPSQRGTVVPLNERTLRGSMLVRDVAGEGQWILQLDHPRELYQQGLVTVRGFLAFVLLAFLVVGALVVVFTDRLILRRLESLSRQLGQTGHDGTWSGRVALRGGDELGTLAAAINGLLDRLERASRERLAWEDRIREAQKAEAVGRLAGGIAHDFNNILTAVLGYCGQLVRRHQLAPAAGQCVAEVEKLADRAATLTRQLLAFSRRQVLQPRVLDLNRLVTDTERVLRPVVGENIDLAIVLADGALAVNADPSQLEQVLVNLALNAHEAMGRGGRLTLETGVVKLAATDLAGLHGLAAGEYVTLDVRDTGVGMSVAVKTHLFEPFFTTKGVGQGTGLGLATCYGIVKQSGGDIRVVSEVGQGTAVTIYLPRVAACPGRPPVTASPDDGLPRGSETVMVVEDEPAVREMSVAMLRDLGYQVLEAANGADALRVADQAAATPIDLLLTDMVMPVMGGAELAASFADRRPRTKVLFTSGYTDASANGNPVLDADAEFLPKPFTSITLARKVRQVLADVSAT